MEYLFYTGSFTEVFNDTFFRLLMKKVLSVLFIALLLIPFSSQQLALAVPAANQLVPVAVINTAASASVDAFGVTYDPVNDLIWANPSGGGLIHQYTPLKNLVIGALPIDGVTGLPELAVTSGAPTPLAPSGLGNFQAIGFDSVSGQIVLHQPSDDTMQGIDPFTGLNKTPYSSPAIDAAILAAPTSFFDGFDIEGTDAYWSPEPAVSRDAFKNAAIFLDNTNPLQTDISAVWIGNGGPTITRWAGIEAANNFVYAVSEVSLGADRTVATYDLAGNFVAVDPDGSPFAQRLEDLAFDGRFLYGASLGDSRIFVFDIVGPGGLQPVGGEIIPIDSTALLVAGAQANYSILMVLALLGAGVFGALFYSTKKIRR